MEEINNLIAEAQAAINEIQEVAQNTEAYINDIEELVGYLEDGGDNPIIVWFEENYPPRDVDNIHDIRYSLGRALIQYVEQNG
jgi:hypothetical protein